ncbi:MAG: hypothetical protein JJU05_12665 [Verrucomicrobia bacterium]|nr:hypothetical protein [Verrucomicrobiota bacterium]MCH8528378.1 hypothetical protein [Kiritimatiellia bacterium]
MKEIFDAIGTRLKSPLFGYTFFAFLAINWKAIFYVFASDDEIIDRFVYFDTQTSLQSLIVYPVLFSVCTALIYPWINYFFLWVGRVPADLKNILQATTEHKLLLKKQEMQELRTQALATKEQELIDRAKRDQEIEDIDDEEARSDLQKQLKNLRMENDQLSSKINLDSEDSKKESRLKALIDTYKTMAEDAKNNDDIHVYASHIQNMQNAQQQLANFYRNKI